MTTHPPDGMMVPEAVPWAAEAAGMRANRGGFHVRLRAATRERHDGVDALFGKFDLSNAESYADFLTTHAMALVPIEDWANLGGLIDPWAGRKVALYEDLAALGRSFPSFETIAWPRDPASRWGAAYVIEGSRLGGAMLSRRVGEGLPRAYLSSAHPPGAWRAFLRRLDVRAEQEGEAFRAGAIVAADKAFALYAQAARRMVVH